MPALPANDQQAIPASVSITRCRQGLMDNFRLQVEMVFLALPETIQYLLELF